jgi:hypothetical protein
MTKNITVAFALVLVFAAGSSRAQDGSYAPPPPMDPKRKVNEQDCAKQVETDGRGNLKCRDISERERRRMIAEEERQAKARKEAA